MVVAIDAVAGLPPVERARRARGRARGKAGAPPPTLRLDVSRAGLVTGSVELPAGVTDDELKVRVEGEGLDAGVPCARRHDGTKLSVPVPGDRPVTISVSHPACVPDGESGSITLTTPRDGVVLRLRAR